MKHFTLSLISLVISFMTISAATSENLFIIGSACKCGWDIGGAYEMQRLNANLFYWQGELNSNGEFKFLPEREWALSFTPQIQTPGNQTVTDGQTVTLHERLEHQADNKFTIDRSGIYNVIVDLAAMQMVCTLEKAIPELFIFGTACGIADNPENIIAMTLLETGNFTWTGDLDASTNLLFLTSRNLYPRYMAASETTLSGDDETIVSLREITSADNEDNSHRINVAREGNYTIEVNPDNLSATFTYHPEELYICGNALCGRQGVWHQNEQYIKPMQPASTPHIFTWTGYLYAWDNDDNRAEFKFRKGGPDNGSWDGYVSATDVNQAVEPGTTYTIADTSSPEGRADRKFEVPENGIYTVIANTRALTATIHRGEVSLSTAVAPSTSIRVVGREIMVSATSPLPVSVHTVSGSSVISATIAEGSLSLPAAGLYIISCGNETLKISVK